MSKHTGNQYLIKKMVDDMGLENLSYADISQIPQWLYDLCEELIRNGWRKKS